jgi:hypothetical protein
MFRGLWSKVSVRACNAHQAFSSVPKRASPSERSKAIDAKKTNAQMQKKTNVQAGDWN